VQNNFNGPTTIVNFPQNDTASAFPIIRTKLLDYAVERRLMKRDGIVYEPVPDCPCAYREAFTYADYVNEVLQGDPIYTSNPKRFRDAVEYLTNYKDAEMPRYEPDRNLMSFANGVLELDSGAFTGYEGVGTNMERRVARHHIHLQYTGSPETPLLDKVLGTQFDHDVAELLCALFGRALFKVGQLDGWQVMPYLVGIGGTGKSLLLNILQHMFAPGAVGNLASKREEVFGMANLVDKEIVMGRDMPAKLTGSLPQELMQAMTAGEGMEVPRKGQVALNVTWAAPVVLASNHMPDYVNTGNNVGRRLVTCRFDNVVGEPQEDLQNDIINTELANVVCRCLRAYSDTRARVRQVGGFWKAVPKTVLDWQSKLAAATNKLHEFLAMEDDERGFGITKAEGKGVAISRFRELFESKMGHGTYKEDASVLHRFGFRVSEKAYNVCGTCKHLPNGGKCCAQYDNKVARPKLKIIHDMVCGGLGQQDN
jgi:phage/plasmid-associated DNA primase